MLNNPVQEFFVCAHGFPIKFHTNLCGDWYVQDTLARASRFISEAAARECAEKHNLTNYRVLPFTASAAQPVKG